VVVLKREMAGLLTKVTENGDLRAGQKRKMCRGAPSKQQCRPKPTRASNAKKGPAVKKDALAFCGESVAME
jgi:hypothetical protein